METGDGTARLPDIPKLRCTECGGERFIPLTYPADERIQSPDPPGRATAKCVTCGRRSAPQSLCADSRPRGVGAPSAAPDASD
jgi:ribosomal protein S14